MTSEHYAGREADNARGRAISQLTRKATFLVKEKYGARSPDPRPYHGIEHTLWVMSAAYMLGRRAVQNGNIPAWQLELLLLDGAYHDVFHERGATNNEHKSAQLAAADMAAAGVFYDQEIALVQDGIIATQVQSATSRRIVQSAESRSYFARLMADADLSSFGAPHNVFWDFAQRYFAETNPGVEFKGQAFDDFVRQHVHIVGGHKYYTDEARQVFPYQAQNVDFLTAQLAGH
ncbi:MAG TPA: HD domain-containing protein [Candidatus Saccharimonadales bacterium]|nr:HD domain-containing protein [Candidatus Saccharimonadales bacterium]